MIMNKKWISAVLSLFILFPAIYIIFGLRNKNFMYTLSALFLSLAIGEAAKLLHQAVSSRRSTFTKK